MSLIDNALQALLKASTRKLVWQNASPESNFPGQKINVDLAGVNRITVVFAYSALTNDNRIEIIVNKNFAAQAIFHGNIIGSNAYVLHTLRNTTLEDDGVTFTDAYRKSGETASGSSNETSVIPIAIYALGN